MSFYPKYKQIASKIRMLIDNGEFNTSKPLPTESELCKRFSVSRSTVTKALEELRYVNVIYTIHGSGSYVDKRYFSSLQSNDDSNIVSIILPFADYERSTRIDETIIIKSLEKQLSKHRFFPMIHYCRDNCDSFYEAVKKMQSFPHEGMIAYTPKDAALLIKKFPDISELLTRQPTVLLDQSIPGINLPCIRSNFFNNGVIATQHLFDCGYTKLFFCSTVSINHNSSIQERYAGFKKVLDKNKYRFPSPYIYIKNDETNENKTNIDYLVEVIQQLVSQHPNERLGFICYCDYMGIEFYEACQRLKLRVPEDVGIMGFGNINSTLPNGKQLSTVDYNHSKNSATAVKTLLSMIQNRPYSDSHHNDGILISRDTTIKL